MLSFFGKLKDVVTRRVSVKDFIVQFMKTGVFVWPAWHFHEDVRVTSTRRTVPFQEQYVRDYDTYDKQKLMM